MKLTLISTTLLLLRCLINSCFAAPSDTKGLDNEGKAVKYAAAKEASDPCRFGGMDESEKFFIWQLWRNAVLSYFFTGSIKIMRSCGTNSY
jgi:hypothetical protein